jgi:sugar O-acyltransferase (sialic acid O-acetyltransferase NeuD family)
MKKVIAIGAGGSAKVLFDLFKREKTPLRITGLLDDDPGKIGTVFHGVKVLGKIAQLTKYKFDEVLLCVGATKDTKARHRIFEFLLREGVKLTRVISKQCLIAPSAKIGDGCILLPGVHVNAGAVLEENVFLNTGVIVEHDCLIGYSAFLSPGCVLSGYVRIGHNTFLGSGSVVSGRVKIGSQVTVGAGSVVVRDIPDRTLCLGNPAHHHAKSI